MSPPSRLGWLASSSLDLPSEGSRLQLPLSVTSFSQYLDLMPTFRNSSMPPSLRLDVHRSPFEGRVASASTLERPSG